MNLCKPIESLFMNSFEPRVDLSGLVMGLNAHLLGVIPNGSCFLYSAWSSQLYLRW